MAEASKKKPRKSKLILRECVEIIDESDTSTQMQELVQEASQTLLPKLKSSIDNESYFEKSPSPVQFSIQVDVESCCYEEDTPNQDEDMEEINIDELNLSLPKYEVIVSNDNILEEVEKLSASKQSYCDRRIQVDVRNYLGKFFVQHVPDHHEAMIQEVMNDWKFWYSQSKIRGLILAYKCNICSIGWWYLGPFQEHIRIHKDVKLSINTCNHECCIVASQGEWFETMCLCQIEGNCPQCLKTYEQHRKRKLHNTFYYHCEGCSERFTTCCALFAHEGDCIRFRKIIFRNAIPTESMWKCEICNVYCLTQDRYDQHYLLQHSVRSDNPAYFPTMKSCTFCSHRYHIYALHACPAKMDNIKCTYCNKKFLNRTLAELHMRNTKKDYYCKICNRYLKSQCMESEHLLKHSKNYILTLKCHDCSDYVLVCDEDGLRRHKLRIHFKRLDRRRDFYPMIVPRSCMSIASRLEEDTLKAMVIDKSKGPNKAITGDQPPKKLTEATIKVEPNEQTISESLNDKTLDQASNEIIVQRNNKKESETDIVRIDDDDDEMISSDMKNKTCNTAQSVNEELINAIEGLKNEDSNETSLDVQIKQEYIDDIFVTDDDIKETQNSVDALLGIVINKDDKDIRIEEPNWDCIVIGDSTDDESQDAGCSNKNDSEHHNVDLTIVKKEPDSEILDVGEYSGTSNRVITTDVTIKEEKEDDMEYDDDNESDIKKEHDACLEELSKVFRASKDAKSLELTGISLAEEVAIKDEPMDEDYEDDIIMLCTDKTRFDFTQDTVKENAEQKTTSDMSKDLNSDMDTEFELDVKIKNESLQPDDNEEANVESISGPDESDPKWSPKTDRKIIKKFKNKLYRCKKCRWVGNHRAFAEHKSTVCIRKKHTKPRGRPPLPSIWPDIVCTKCDTHFDNTKSYFMHFTKHNMKLGRCPRCNKCCVARGMERHLTSHIKNSFIKLQVLQHTTTYTTSRNTGVYQCKTCQNKVQFKDFFVHWERHLDLNALKESNYPESVSNSSSQLKEAKYQEAVSKLSSRHSSDSSEEDRALSSLVVVGEDEEKNKKKASNFQLSPDELKIAFEQLQAPPDRSSHGDADREKRCLLCKRNFGRRNDVKRHIVEHLLRDAQSRVPALLCHLCQFRTNKADVYKTHMRNHAALPVFKCELCNKWFSDSSNFAKHKKVHNVNVLSKCELCGRKFNKQAGLEKHMEMHATTEPVKCEYCDKTFFTQSAYNKHRKAKHEKTGLSRYCRICLTKFSTMRSMWTHMWEVHKERRTKADCPICGKPFRKQQDVRTHLRDVHYIYKMKLMPARAHRSTNEKRAPRSTDDETRAHRSSEDDIESFLQNHNEIEIGEDGEETLVIYEDDDVDDS